jgi:hypothetical protein
MYGLLWKCISLVFLSLYSVILFLLFCTSVLPCHFFHRFLSYSYVCSRYNSTFYLPTGSTKQSSERVKHFRYFETTQTNKNSIHEEINSRLCQRMLAIIQYRILCLPVCYPKIWRLRDIGTTILAIVLHGCETWLLTFREEDRLRVFKNKVLRKIFGPIQGEWRRLHN